MLHSGSALHLSYLGQGSQTKEIKVRKYLFSEDQSVPAYLL